MSAPEGHPPVLRPLILAATVFILFANLLTLVVGIAPNLDTRIVDIGEVMWPGYAAELRQDPAVPDCDLAALKERLATCPADGGTPAAPAGEDPFGGEDPFADPGAAPKPAAAPVPAAVDPFGGEDPFADPAAAPKPAPAPAPAAAPDQAFGGDDPFAAPAAAPADDPFAPSAPSAAVNCPALRSLHDQCAIRHQEYDHTVARLTSGIRSFRSVELAVSDVAKFAFWKHLLVLVVVFGGISATATRVHVALRNPRTLGEHRARQVAELAAHVFWLASCVADWQVQRASTAEIDNASLPVLWAVGFVVLAAINVYHLIRPPADLVVGPTNVGRVLMCIPLFAFLGIGAGLYFNGVEQHWSGQAIYLHKFVAYPNVYLGIALYVWAGMLLSETRVAPRVFDVFQPFKMSAHLLGWLVAVISAVPTAYSGASGIFVIATGKTIFERLREGGASRRVALGATAMSGSLGVVLRPCLIVVLIAVLNRQVTTDALYSAGLWVFLLTSSMYLVAMLLRRTDPLFSAPMKEALPGSLSAAAALIPYVVIGALVVAVYAVVFKTHVNENTAALILPALMLVIVLYDRLVARRAGAVATVRPGEPLRVREAMLWPPLARATGESSHNAGALLMVMAGSVGLGGVVERSDVMAVVPQDLGSPAMAMFVLVVVMILVGMALDALGAVILVSVTIAPLAYKNGIDPVHFWMMGLVAFELGYLHPPVGLNILLARQVIGKEAEVERFPVEGGFFERYEHVIVPCLVMAAALVIVAFVPFFWYPLGS